MRERVILRLLPVGTLVLVAAWSAMPTGQAGSGLSAALGQSLSRQDREIADRVRVETIRDVTVTLASPEMEGRGTAQPGGVKAAKYLAGRFAKLGLKPLGDQGSYLQAVPFEAMAFGSGSSLKIEGSTLKEGTDYRYWIRPSFLSSRSIDARGKAVLVSHAILLESLLRNDPTGLDVKGKIVVDPGGPLKRPASAAPLPPDSLEQVVSGLARQGAAGVIVIAWSDSNLTAPAAFGVAQRRRVFLAETRRSVPGDWPPVAFLSLDAAKRLLPKSPEAIANLIDKAQAGERVLRELGVEVEMSVPQTLEPAIGHNVIGLLEGADPQLKAEAVVYSAHYDAWGKDARGRIFPGAADNALGVAKMLAVAEAMSQTPNRPRRSVIFLAPTGEEHYMLGTHYWLEHPTWPVAKIAADLNIDGIDNDTYGPVKAIYGVGLGLSNLDRTIFAVARDMRILFVPELGFDRQNAFQRSDQYEFALRGVPTVYVFGLAAEQRSAGKPAKPKGLLDSLSRLPATAGQLVDTGVRAKRFLDNDYHQPSDVVRPEWDWQGVRTAAVFYLVTGLRVANAEKMPEWRPGSRFSRGGKKKMEERR